MQTQRPVPESSEQAWDDWAGGVLAAFDQFQLLCAVRKGAWGVEALNERIAEALVRRGLLEQAHGWYEGRPVLVTRNDYSLGLMNGDIGIALRLPEPPEVPGAPMRQVLRVVFPRNDGSGALRHILPSRLSAVETVFAMTVHKSQGSEFRHAALVLPESHQAVSRELLYTAITRARQRFTLAGTAGALAQPARPTVRASGLAKRLHG